MKIEGMNKSSAIRHLIRLGARTYGLLPSVDYSQQVEQTANDLLVCEKCGQDLGLKLEEAYRIYAAQLGKNVDALTEQEKKQAFVNNS